MADYERVIWYNFMFGWKSEMVCEVKYMEYHYQSAISFYTSPITLIHFKMYILLHNVLPIMRSIISVYENYTYLWNNNLINVYYEYEYVF